MCGKLNKAMYGTRDATQNSQRKCAGTVLRSAGYLRDTSFTRNGSRAAWCMATTSYSSGSRRI